jgi:glycosyltransferase involved in cell wall biosynthesis
LAKAARGREGRLRIAHVGSKGLPARGGTERVVEAIATRHSVEHEVTVYGSQRICSNAIHEGVRVVALPVPAGKRSGPVVLDILSALAALWAGYDVVHVHGSENTFVVPLLRLRSRVVTTNHGSPYEQKKWGSVARFLMRMIEGGSVRWPSAATCVAATRAARLESRYGVRVHYIPNGIDRRASADLDAAASFLAANGLQPQDYVMFSAARVDPTKGCLTLIRAWRAAATGGALLVVGDLWHSPSHEAELREAAAGAHVVFVPRLDDTGLLLGLIAQSALFAFPSTVEAMSMMLLEAVSTGARVLASDIAENTSVLPKGFPTFRTGDEADLTRTMLEALSWPQAESAARYALYAEEMARTYDWDRIAEQYMELYREATLP